MGQLSISNRTAPDRSAQTSPERNEPGLANSTQVEPIPEFSSAVSPAVQQRLQAALAPSSDPAAAQDFARQLTRGHYENFSVISLLLPRHLRQDFCNVYAFCRIADDMADELSDAHQASEALRYLKDQTLACYEGRSGIALFAALGETIARHSIPAEPFLDLIDAFQQDQRVRRYDDFAGVVDYCRRSADPVGRLVLYMCGYRDERRQQLSDRTCTALQLANFWQDVRRDLLDRDRIYLPGDAMRRFGVSESQIREGRCDDGYRAMLRELVDQTQAMFDEGENLLPLLNPSVRRQVGLFGRGGRAVLSAIQRRNYDTLSRRPVISRWTKARLVLSTFAAGLLARVGPGGRA